MTRPLDPVDHPYNSGTETFASRRLPTRPDRRPGTRASAPKTYQSTETGFEREDEPARAIGHTLETLTGPKILILTTSGPNETMLEPAQFLSEGLVTMGLWLNDA